MRGLGELSPNPAPHENSKLAEMVKSHPNCDNQQSVCGKDHALILVDPLADKDRRNPSGTGYIFFCEKRAITTIPVFANRQIRLVFPRAPNMTPMRSKPKHKPRTIPLLDMREGPGHQMGTMSLRIPSELIEALSYRAGKLRTSRAVLCRNLLAQGLDDLETADAAWGELGPVSDADEHEGRQVLAQGVEALEAPAAS
jgi:predicted DNA-binding protein